MHALIRPSISAYHHATHTSSLSPGLRAFSSSQSLWKVSPLDANVSGENEKVVIPGVDRDSNALRMIMFGKPGAGKVRFISFC